jgi:superfamily I DNA/RNA helicase
MGTWLLPRTDLTPDQLRAVELPPTEHRVVMGLPGSGKTQVLVHRAVYLREYFHVPADGFRIFIFNNVLKDYIRSGLDLLNLPEASVCTFDGWCTDVYRQHVSRRLPWNAGARRPDFAHIREAVLKLVSVPNRGGVHLDFALVDEGQDLAATSFAIVQRVAKHVTVFADHLQQVYNEGADEGAILTTFGLSRRNISLLGAYRNSPDVAQLAACFIGESEKRQQYLQQTANNRSERERPLFYSAASAKDEVDRLAEVVRQRQMLNQRVGIIVPQNDLVYGLAEGLAERGVTVEVAVASGAKTRARHLLADFGSMLPKIATYHQAKGLTFDCVLLPRLTDHAFWRFSSEERRRLLFVGIARATQWAYLSIPEGKGMAELSPLYEAEANRHLTVQRGSSQGLLPEDEEAPRLEEMDDAPSVL